MAQTISELSYSSRDTSISANSSSRRGPLVYSSQNMELICSILKGLEESIKLTSRENEDQVILGNSMYDQFERLKLTRVKIFNMELFEENLMNECSDKSSISQQLSMINNRKKQINFMRNLSRSSDHSDRYIQEVKTYIRFKIYAPSIF